MRKYYGEGGLNDPNWFKKKSLGRERLILKGSLTDKLVKKLDTIRKSETDYKDLKHPLYLEMIEFHFLKIFHIQNKDIQKYYLKLL